MMITPIFGMNQREKLVHSDNSLAIFWGEAREFGKGESSPPSPPPVDWTLIKIVIYSQM